MPGFLRETGQIKEFVPRIQFVKSQNPVGHLGQSKFNLSIFAKISANVQKRWCSLSISSTVIIVTSHERHGVSNHQQRHCCSSACSGRWFKHQNSPFLALCKRDQLVIGGFPSQRASNAWHLSDKSRSFGECYLPGSNHHVDQVCSE